MAALLPLADAQAQLLALAPVLPIETLPLIEAAGRWTAEPVPALRTQPAADLSAMDGYAIRFAEMPGPWRVVGESAAGSAPGLTLAPGEAARIFTGAPVPPGADVILVQEEAAREPAPAEAGGDRLTLAGEGPARPGAHIRRTGSDFRTGDALIAPGERLTPARIALAATGGHGALAVRRRPRIALISTGDELVPAGEPVEGVHLPSSNAPMLATLLAAETPALVEDRGIVPDDLAATIAAFDAARGADVIVTTGGASVGDRDLVRPALEAAGATIDFWRVALKPGKPIMAAKLGNTIVLGLPGNPVSAFVTARLFLLPLVRHMCGAADPFDSPQTATLSDPLPATGKRMEFLRAQRSGGMVQALGSQDSAALAMLAAANALIVRPPFAPAAAAGDVVELFSIA